MKSASLRNRLLVAVAAVARSELRNRRQALQVRSAQYQATVGLVRALGGAWSTE